MSGEFRDAEGNRRRRFAIPGTDGWVTWLGEEDPTEEDLEAFKALAEAAIKADAKGRLATSEPPGEEL